MSKNIIFFFKSFLTNFPYKSPKNALHSTNGSLLIPAGGAISADRPVKYVSFGLRRLHIFADFTVRR